MRGQKTIVETNGSARPAACFDGQPARVEESLSVIWEGEVQVTRVSLIHEPRLQGQG